MTNLGAVKKAYIYARISESEQSNFSISGQVADGKEYCRRNDIAVSGVFVDDGFSAKNFERPSWKNLLRSLRANYREVDFVVVMKFDRLIRNAAEGLATIEKLERRYNIRVVSIQETISIDPNSPFYFKMRADMLVNADFERRVISERSKYGVWRAKMEGRFLGRAPYGYRNERDADGRPIIVVDEEQADVVQWIFQQYAAGVSVATIRRGAQKRGFQLSGKMAVERIVGKSVYKGIIEVPAFRENAARSVSGVHEAIIDPDIWETANDRLNGRQRQNMALLREEMPLRGVLLCPDCEKAMTGSGSRGNGGVYFYYRCDSCGDNFSAIRTHQKFERLLGSLSFTSSQLEKIGEAVRRKAEKRMKESGRKKARLLREVSELEEKIHNMEDRYFAGKIADATFKKWSGIYSRDLNGKRAELTRINEQSEDVWERVDNYRQYLTGLSKLYNSVSVETKQRLVRAIFPGQLFRTSEGFGTKQLNELLALNANGIKGLQLIGGDGNAQETSNSPISTRKGELGEPLFEVFKTIAA